MKQRVFPWIQGLYPPTDAPRKTVAQCESYGMAVRVALEMKPGGPWSESWLAARLGISRGYLSRLLNAKQDAEGRDVMPDWILRPIAYATGSRLIEQYHALRTFDEQENARAAIRRIAQQAVAQTGVQVERRHEARAAA